MEGSRTARGGLGWVGNIRPVSCNFSSARFSSPHSQPARLGAVLARDGNGRRRIPEEQSSRGKADGGPLSLSSS